ncbi:senescence/dehydration-associated protein At4g35985, chloroplastic-like isoform X1 [Nicotiana tomentosiformis]|uniref:senescence/dehydration-associated protein At4g35985, chloroplastic-like isoform X1 n=1 Tax=Nicotiana tomentosiformis TaxID=4098 RepID=UPI00051B9D9D|nr:senescence/dehydration-associated protein At4g35985, chloroplastic-like isoform X1 [Nicotiana tomentosiformis]
MSCCKPKRSKSFAISKTPSQKETLETKNIKHEVLLSIPGCKVHLMDEGETLELSNGFFTIFSISEEDVCVATIVKVGDELQWPLTKDEPVVKLDALHYLFTLPVKDCHPLSYGVTFTENGSGNLGFLDAFLKENTLFTSSISSNRRKDIEWKEFAPRIEDYNNVLAKAIAGGTGQIVKGIFKCSNAYTNQVQKGGENILIPAVENSGSTATKRKGNVTAATKKNAVNESLKRVRNLSKMTEKMSKSMLNGVGIATGSVMGPMVRSQAGKKFLAMVPGEVLLASLDAINKILDAAEAAEKQTLSATSGAVTRIVTNRFGENAGEATEDALATAGHCAGTAWNVFKIRKALNPASSVSSGALNTAKTRK